MTPDDERGFTVSDLTDTWPERAIPVVEALRRLVAEVAPDATERAYRGWGLIGYTINQYVCAIYPSGDHVRLLFERGVELEDPGGLLEGRGSKTRYVAVRALETLPKAEVEALLGSAIALQE